MEEIIRNLISVTSLNDYSSSVGLLEAVDDIESESFSSEKLTHLMTSMEETESDRDVVKLISSAIQIASENGSLEYPTSPIYSALTAVNITKQLNASYLLETGEMAVHEMSDILLDQATANASVIADVALSQPVLEQGINRVLDFVSCAYPPIATAAQCAKQFTPAISSYVSQKVRPVVKEAIHNASSWVRTTLHSTISAVATKTKTTINKIGNKLKSFISKKR